jgi:hypothetical protein
MNDKGFITTEEFWEETIVDENGVEGETRVVAEPAKPVVAKPKAAAAKLAANSFAGDKASPKSKAKVKKQPAAAPAEGDAKPKKSKKAAGTRDIMCVAPVRPTPPPPPPRGAVPLHSR